MSLRLAEFVTKTIDNSTHGLTVQKAMENLGLEECAQFRRLHSFVVAHLGFSSSITSKKDLLFGMEVRLLPHQIIGVSWLGSFSFSISQILTETQDVATGA